MSCALCLKSAELRQSHVIPEFFFRQVYDAIHRCQLISTECSTPERYVQKGLREQMLCDTCEKKFSRWEKYAKEAFVDGKGVALAREGNWLVIHGLDYRTFRLFQLSLLWRMSVTSLPFFKEVDLGPHEEKLRLALLSDNPLEPDQYPCLLVAVKIDGQFYQDGILQPSVVRIDGNRCYRIMIAGILFTFHVGNQPIPIDISPFILSKQNELRVLVQDIRNIPFLADAAVQFGAAIRQRERE
jgi:hypothetical protein